MAGPAVTTLPPRLQHERLRPAALRGALLLPVHRVRQHSGGEGGPAALLAEGRLLLRVRVRRALACSPNAARQGPEGGVRRPRPLGGGFTWDSFVGIMVADTRWDPPPGVHGSAWCVVEEGPSVGTVTGVRDMRAGVCAASRAGRRARRETQTEHTLQTRSPAASDPAAGAPEPRGAG